METLEQLKTVLSPPPRCGYRPNADADRELRQAIGHRLPATYLKFLDCYGPGDIQTVEYDLNFLTVFEPATILRQNQTFFRALGEPLPREDWPQVHWKQKGGWLIWGYSCDGHQYYWRMEGEPDLWPIVVEDRYSMTRESFDMDLPAFLHAILTGQINPRGIPSAIKPGDTTPVWVQHQNQVKT